METTNWIIAIATGLNVFFTMAIACFAYQSNRLNKTIHNENKDQSQQIEQLYWGMIVSNILNIDDPSMRKRKLNILFTLFKVEEIVEKAGIPSKAFESILKDIDGNVAEQVLNNYKNK